MRTKPLPVKRVAAPLRQQALENLRQSCIDGFYSPGDRLTETALTKDLGVSRTVVRETLRQLESEGLVEIVPNVGAVVRTITKDEVRDLYEVRALLESLIASQCATRATPEQKKDVLAHFSQVQEHIDHAPGDISTLLEYKNELMKSILAGSGNVVAGGMLQNIHARVSRFRELTLSAPGRLSETKSELGQTVDAICQGDAERASALSAAHVRNAGAIALKHYA